MFRKYTLAIEPKIIVYIFINTLIIYSYAKKLISWGTAF